MDLVQLIALRDALKAARYQGVLSIKAGDKWVTYKSDAEMRTALSALEREIAAAQGKPKSRGIKTYASKGL